MIRNRMPILASILLFTSAIAACGVLIPGSNPDQGSANNASARPTFAKNGSLAPEINLKSLTGDQIVLSKLEGHPVLVNFWATWCGPCREEFPAIQRAYKKYKDQGFIVIGVNFQDENSDAGVLTFLRNSVANFPVVRDTGERVGRMYNVRGLPTSFFIDKNGIIVDTVVGGPMTDDFLDAQWGKISQ